MRYDKPKAKVRFVIGFEVKAINFQEFFGTMRSEKQRVCGKLRINKPTDYSDILPKN